MTKTPTVERYGIALSQRGRAWPAEGETVEVPGKAGRLAHVLSVTTTWSWREESGEWRASFPRVEQADVRKDGSLGAPYDRGHYRDGTAAAFEYLIEASRPTFRPVFEEIQA